jgi:hypothetical protein
MMRTPHPRGQVIAAVVATLAGGILLDARGPSWGQGAVVVWTWCVLGWIAAGSTAAHRRELAVCLVLATLGEWFLMEVWGLYEYRLGNLPLFIPPGHAIVFAASTRTAPSAPPWLPAAVALAGGLYVAWAGWTGLDTFGVVWFVAFLCYLIWSRDPGLCAVLFLFALAIEVYGTSLGGWQYFTREPWFGLATTNPPMWVGAIYCTLETLVRVTAGRLPSLDVLSAATSRASARYHAIPANTPTNSTTTAAVTTGSVHNHLAVPACHSS